MFNKISEELSSGEFHGVNNEFFAKLEELAALINNKKYENAAAKFLYLIYEHAIPINREETDAIKE